MSRCDSAIRWICRRGRAAAFLLVAAWWCASPLRAEEPARKHPVWKPERTFVFAVSSTDWKYDRKLNMPKEGRQDQALVSAFLKRGVRADHMAFLKDDRGTLARINQEFVRLLKRSEPADMLIFYFQGHGSRDIHGKKSTYYFVNYDANDDDDASSLYMKGVYDTIEAHFKGSSALMVADCCCSGGLIVEARKRKSKIHYACLASVAAHNGSTAAWTFTDALVKGLLGGPAFDLDNDGSITLDELRREIEVEMAVVEEQKAAFAALEGFDAELKLGAAGKKAHPDVGKFVEAEQDGTWYTASIDDFNGQKFSVRYTEYDGEQEWVAPKRIRPLHRPRLKDGTHVSVEVEEGERRKGTVKRTFYGLHLIHFDNDDSGVYDEWFTRKQVSPVK